MDTGRWGQVHPHSCYRKHGLVLVLNARGQESKNKRGRSMKGYQDLDHSQGTLADQFEGHSLVVREPLAEPI